MSRFFWNPKKKRARRASQKNNVPTVRKIARDPRDVLQRDVAACVNVGSVRIHHRVPAAGKTAPDADRILQIDDAVAVRVTRPERSLVVTGTYAERTADASGVRFGGTSRTVGADQRKLRAPVEHVFADRRNG